MAKQIKLSDFLKNRDKMYPKEYSKEIEMNCLKTIQAVDEFLKNFIDPITVASGWRDKQSNAAAGGAPSSCHLTGEAVDIKDTTGELWNYVLNHLEEARDLGLFFEDRRATPTWVHFQTRPVKSGKRIYIPNTKPFLAPDIWSGDYNHKYDELLH